MEDMMTSNAAADFEVYGGGSIFLLTPLNANAKEFLYARLGDEAQFMGEAVAVEHRYIGAIVEDLRAEGFSV